MSVEILMSTMNRNHISELGLDQKKVNSPVLVINQAENDNQWEGNGQRMYNYRERGLSKSRNRALGNAIGEYCLFVDDDVSFQENYVQVINQAFAANPTADVITFQIATPEGLPYKQYETESFRHTKRSILRVSSVEIAFRRKSIIKTGIRFDECFGLGAPFTSGEENIFLSDCLEKGLELIYIPVPIVVHQMESSGKRLSKSAMQSKGALFFRLFGQQAVFMNLAFAAKKLPMYYRQFTIIKAVKWMRQGMREYRASVEEE